MVVPAPAADAESAPLSFVTETSPGRHTIDTDPGDTAANVKLALVTETFPPDINGVALTFGRIARELARRGHEVTVYHPLRPAAVASPAIAPYRQVALPGFPLPGYPQLRFGFPAWRQLERRFRADPPDLVHVVTEGPLGASAVSVARRLQIPVTSSFHTNFHVYMRHYRVPLLRRAALGWLRRVHNRTACTFAPTTGLGSELAADGFRRLRLLSRGIDRHHFSPARREAQLRQRWGATADAPVVLHVGRLAPEKDYPLLFQTFAAMRAADPRCRFVLVGDGPLRVSLERAHPECRFTGFLPPDELAAHYASADIYIHASRSETFGNVLVEALASGLAVAGFDYAAAQQLIHSGRHGLLVPLDRPDLLVHAAVRLVHEPALRAQLRRFAPDAVAAHSWDRVIDGFERELLHLAGTASASRPLAATCP